VLERGPTVDAALRRQGEQSHQFLAGRFGLFSRRFVGFERFGVDARGRSVHEADVADGAPHQPQRASSINGGFDVQRVDLQAQIFDRRLTYVLVVELR